MYDKYKGIIDLVQFMKDEYGYEYINDDELIKQPFVSYEGTGATARLWFTDKKGDSYLFKYSPDFSYSTIYGELISSKLCKMLDISCSGIRACKFNGQIGILSKKITKKDEKIITGGEIIQNVLDKYYLVFHRDETISKPILQDELFLELYNIPECIHRVDEVHKLNYVYNNLNNLEQLWSIVALYVEFNGYSNERMQEIVDSLVRTFVFDIITMQSDRHIGNWGIIYNEQTKDIGKCPLWDNSDILNLAKEDLLSYIRKFNDEYNTYIKFSESEEVSFNFCNLLYKNRLLLTVSEQDITNAKAKKRKNNMEVLSHFLEITGSPYIEIFLDYINKAIKINFPELIEQIEKENGIIMDNEVREHIIKVWECNLNFIKQNIKRHGLEVNKNNVI